MLKSKIFEKIFIKIDKNIGAMELVKDSRAKSRVQSKYYKSPMQRIRSQNWKALELGAKNTGAENKE